MLSPLACPSVGIYGDTYIRRRVFNFLHMYMATCFSSKVLDLVPCPRTLARFNMRFALLMAMALATSNATPLPAGTDRFEDLPHNLTLLQTHTTVADTFLSSLSRRRFSLLYKRDEAPSPSPPVTIVLVIIFVVGALLAVACRVQVWYTKKRSQKHVLAQAVSSADDTPLLRPAVWPASSPTLPADYAPMPRDSTKEPVENMTGSPLPACKLPLPDFSKEEIHVEVSEETQSRTARGFRVPPPAYKLPAGAEDSRHDISSPLPRAKSRD